MKYKVLMKYKVFGLIEEMGSYSTVAHESPMETVYENALWDFNSARKHDGLHELTMEQFMEHIMNKDVRFVRLKD